MVANLPLLTLTERNQILEGAAGQEAPALAVAASLGWPAFQVLAVAVAVETKQQCQRTKAAAREVNLAWLLLMQPQAAQPQAWGHSLAELPHLVLQAAVVPGVALTQQQLMLAALADFPAVAEEVVVPPLQQAQQPQVVLAVLAL